MSAAVATIDLLRLTLVDGVGPVLGRRLVERFGGAARVFEASPGELERVQGIGATRARRMWQSMREADAALEQELALAERLGVRFIGLGDAGYPPLLAQCPDGPLILSVRGADPCGEGTFPVAIVGSRHCTHYGMEQAERFAAGLAQHGLVIVSGGARGIDSAAHRAAARVGMPTVVVLGCGLSHCYPPENSELFDRVLEAGGSLVSELPLSTAPSPENFPARNRIIAGLSLGVLVIEAPRGSGALITARVAIDEYNREVLAVPGRVDSRSSEGSNDLIKRGEAGMATAPADVLDALESAARHAHGGTHEARFGPAPRPEDHALPGEGPPSAAAAPPVQPQPAVGVLSETQRQILAALSEPASIDELCKRTGLSAASVQAQTMLLELRRAVVRRGPLLVRGSSQA